VLLPHHELVSDDFQEIQTADAFEILSGEKDGKNLTQRTKSRPGHLKHFQRTSEPLSLFRTGIFPSILKVF
jgi:hypothetical protein